MLMTVITQNAGIVPMLTNRMYEHPRLDEVPFLSMTEKKNMCEKRKKEQSELSLDSFHFYVNFNGIAPYYFGAGRSLPAFNHSHVRLARSFVAPFFVSLSKYWIIRMLRHTTFPGRKNNKQACPLQLSLFSAIYYLLFCLWYLKETKKKRRRTLKLTVWLQILSMTPMNLVMMNLI